MNREALIAAAEAAGFSCSEREIRDLSRENLLRVLRREGRGRKIIIHHEGDALRLLVILALRQSPPAGFGVNRFEKLRSWLGSAGDGAFPDEGMPAIAYILGIAGVSAEEAVKSFLDHIQYQRPRFDRDLMEQAEDTFLPAMAFIFGGLSVYQGPDIYNIADSRTIIQQHVVDGARTQVVKEERFTLRDEIATFVPPALHGNLNAENLAEFARVIDPRRMEDHLRNAAEDRLRRAALAARVLFGPLLSLCREPYAFSLAYVWAFLASLSTEIPAAELIAGELGQLPGSALDQLDSSLGAAAQSVARRKETSARQSLSAGLSKEEG